jgi:tetraacyldisaccharide 4'-kinase
MKLSTYRDVISGADRSFAAEAARCGLKGASLFYELAVRLRNRAFDTGLFRAHRVPVPVVSIGNLTAGGTGKTPMVAAVVEWFVSRGLRPVILSRGYRSAPNAGNDEKLVLDQLCPNVVHLQSPDRVRSAQDACQRHNADVLILDDGFQHRRLARDLDVVLIDALDPWGAGHVLPRGLLREPRSGLSRANLVVLTRADQCSPERKQEILAEIRALVGDRPPVEATFQPIGLVNSSGETAPTESLAEAVAAFCGIGNPEGFRRTLTVEGFASRLAGFRTFPDHHHYTPSDLDDLADWARTCGAGVLITTQKDLVKIPRNDLGGLPLWALAIRAQISVGREEFEARLQELIQGRVPPNCNKFQ